MQVLSEGQKFERYRIIQLLGTGAAGTSYEAEDSKTQRHVLLKLIQPAIPLSDAIRRQFFRDMHASSQLMHPSSIVPILNYGEYHNQLYLIRQFLPLGSLLSTTGRHVVPAPLHSKKAIMLAYRLAHILGYIHQHKLVHGSLTFTNILLQSASLKQSSFLLSDIGNAHFVRRVSHLPTHTFPITAAPEQYHGLTTAASDQYALAVLLYFWVSGHLPFQGLPEEVEYMKNVGLVSPPGKHNSSITSQQEQIILRALSVSPKERYPSMLAFASSLASSLNKAPTYSSTSHNQQQEHENSQVATHQLTGEVKATEQEPKEPHTEPIPQIEPDIPQPHPHPEPEPQPVPQTPIQEPQQEPQAPIQEPITDKPEIIPQPAPDIAQPIPDQTPFGEPPISPKPTIEPESTPAEPPKENREPAINTEPLMAERHTETYLVISSQHLTKTLKVTIDKDQITLGRAGSNDIQLDHDTQTSRHHALIRREGKHYILYDQRSVYGIQVNGQSLTNGKGHLLKHSDQIVIGEYLLVFHAASAHDTSHANGYYVSGQREPV